MTILFYLGKNVSNSSKKVLLELHFSLNYCLSVMKFISVSIQTFLDGEDDMQISLRGGIGSRTRKKSITGLGIAAA